MKKSLAETKIKLNKGLFYNDNGLVIRFINQKQ